MSGTVPGAVATGSAPGRYRSRYRTNLKENHTMSGTVPGAVATGSAPGRYRSRYRTNLKENHAMSGTVPGAVATGSAPGRHRSRYRTSLKENHDEMNTNEAILIPPWQTLRFRLLGFLPLCFFMARAVEYIVIAKTPEQMLWSCHISNLLLAAGLFMGNPFLIRVAVLWLILGVPPWIIEMVWSWQITALRVFTHLGGFIMAIVAIRRVGAKRGSWIPSLIYFVILQQITRLLTDPGPYTNVNVAHFAFGPMKDWFTNYWTYWAANTSVVALTLFITEFVLLRLYPTRAK